MKYPTRAKSHVTETASFKRLDACIPSHWIIRHVSERDYGIDCLIEPVVKPDGPVTGDLLALQLKGTEALTWNKSDDASDDLRTVFSGIEVETVNYWMGLPIPVFLCIHNQASDAIHIADVKRQVRRRYSELLSQKTFGFALRSKLNISDTNAHILLYALYVQERAYSKFGAALTDLLANCDTYVEYIVGNIGLDFFFEVETPELVRLFNLYRNMEQVAYYTGTDWTVPSLYSFLEDDRKKFTDNPAILHEGTHSRILRLLAPLYLEIITRGCKVVTETECDYWKSRELLLHRWITERGVDEWISHAKNELQNIF